VFSKRSQPRPQVKPSTSALVTALSVLGIAGALMSWRGEPAPGEPPPTLARYQPSPMEVVERMLQLANVTRDDVVFDLGSGDGRIVILAATRYGARGVGVEIDPQLVASAREAAKREGVDHVVTFVNADALAVDVSPATVVTLFLSPEANLRLRPKLQSQLRPGARVVSHWHDMGDWPPERMERITPGNARTRPLYLWRIGR
jgi:protein-L-isoaspartate O-methyltransferase